MIAHLALFAWPIVVVVLFRRVTLPLAAAVSILGGYLLLPAKPVFDFPLLPAINKTTIPALSAFAMAWLVCRTAASGPRMRSEDQGLLPGWFPRSAVARGLVALLFIGIVARVLTNGDALVYGGRILPPITWYTGFSACLTSIMMLLPFLLGRKFLSSDDGHRLLVRVLCIAGLLYSIPTLYEVRMSPQLNLMLYGFFPHSWLQHIRGGGYRPIVFLPHGLWLSIFMASAAVAALGMVRLCAKKQRSRYILAVLWLFLTLFLTKSLGASVLAVLGAAVILFTPVRIQLMVAAIVAGIVLTYPMLRGAGLVPVDRVTAWAADFSEDRAGSLIYRLKNEDILLEKANQRPLAGWGGWGRNRVMNEEGEDESVTDGLWIILIGQDGWIGYIAQFGLLGLPLILLALQKRRLDLGPATAILCMILAIGMVDLIPNATLTPMTWLIAGSLMGRLEWKASLAPAARPIEVQDAATPASRMFQPAPAERTSPQYSAGYTRQKHLHERSGI